MSYILEALKKSEQERGHGKVPGIQSVHSSGISYNTARRPLWPYVLIAAVVINLLALLYFIADKRQPAAMNTAVETGSVTLQPETSGGVPGEEKTPAVIPQAAEHSIAAIPREPVFAVDPAPEPIYKPIPVTTGNVSAGEPRQTGARRDNTRAPRSVDADAYTPQRNELPIEIEQQIPGMAFSAHVYSSNPRQRSIVINGRFMEEGEAVSSDLILSEITPDGAIFDFLGYRFRQNVVSGWN
jgi:general secretion pathway protein B